MAQVLREVPRTGDVEARSNLGDLPELFRQLAGDVTEMASARIELAKVEIKQEAVNLVTSTTGITAGGLVALTGFVFGSLALVFVIAQLLLENAFTTGAAYAIGLGGIGLVYLVIGSIVISVMKKRLTQR